MSVFSLSLIRAYSFQYKQSDFYLSQEALQYVINSYPAISVLEGTTFERVEPPCIIFVVLVEAVPDGMSPHFQVLLLQGGRKFFKS